MGKPSFSRVLDTLCVCSVSSSCFCMNSMEFQDDFEDKPLIASDKSQLLRLKDVVAGKQTLSFQLKPQVVMLRVSMHCSGCARKVEKHISKLEGRSRKQDGGCGWRHSSIGHIRKCLQGEKCTALDLDKCFLCFASPSRLQPLHQTQTKGSRSKFVGCNRNLRVFLSYL